MASRSELSAPARFTARHVAAVVAGNGLEFYDFLTYALFAVYISKAFFPAHGPLSLLLTLATFGIGFLTRPVGAVVLGTLGDHIGRKPAMLISFVLMGTGMAGVALTPTYAQIGLAAPILIVCFRLVQGFALGGEVGPTTAYMVEAAPPGRRGFYGCMQAASQDASVLIAAIVAEVLANVLSPAELASWGWRAAFLVGLSIFPFVIFIRATLPETLHATEHAVTRADAMRPSSGVRTPLRPYAKLIVLGLLLLLAGTIGNYTTDYMTTYALDTLHLPARAAFGTAVVTGLCMVASDVTSGYLSDRFGRKPLLVIPAIVLVFMIIPGFWLITRYPSALTLYAVMGTLAIPFSLSSAPIVVALTESLPRAVRSGTVATVYALSISIFGGSTQFTLKSLLTVTHNPMAPAVYWTAAALIGLLAALLMTESAPGKARASDVLDGLAIAPVTE